MNRARGACSRRRIAAATGTPHLQLLKNFGERELFFTARALLHRQKRLSAIRGAAQHCRIPLSAQRCTGTREAITKMKFEMGLFEMRLFEMRISGPPCVGKRVGGHGPPKRAVCYGLRLLQRVRVARPCCWESAQRCSGADRRQTSEEAALGRSAVWASGVRVRNGQPRERATLRTR